MSTINDVARLAGVSSMTVSRVINNSGYTSPGTRARVEQAIAELGYMPNALARQLRSKRTKSLALVLTDITNPFFTTIARGVEDVAGASGFSVMFCNTDESETDEHEYLELLVQRQVDGVLLVPASSEGRGLDLLQTHRLPAVILDRRLHKPQADEVRCDSEAGAYQLVRHLTELGHRRIAMLTGRKTVSTSFDRVAGYTRGLGEAGITVEPELIRYAELNYGGFNQADGYRMAQEILGLAPRPTAIFAANNFIAFGAIRALREAGLTVPEDMSVVAFDDLPGEWVLDPFLTVVAQPAYEIGRRAAGLLLDRLERDVAPEPRAVVLPAELRVRRSSGPPPA